MKFTCIVSLLLASTLVSMAQNIIQSSYYDDHGFGIAYTPGGGLVKSTGSNCARTSNSCIPNMLITTTAGNILVEYSAVYSPSGGTTLGAIPGDTSIAVPQGRYDAGGITLDWRVVPATNGGKKSVPCTFSHASGGYQGCGVIELKAPPSGVVVVNTGGSQSLYCGLTCQGLSLNLSSPGVIIQTIFPDADGASGVSYPYTAVCEGISGSPICAGVGAAVAQATSAGIQQPPVWNVGSFEPVQTAAIALSFVTVPPPPKGLWSFVQAGFYQNQGVAGGPGGTNCGSPIVPNMGSTSCTAFAATPITRGNLLITYSQTFSDGVSKLLSVSEEPGMVDCTQCDLNTQGPCGICGPGTQSMPNVGLFQVDMLYTTSARGGENTITANFPPGMGWWWEGVGFIEAHWSGTGTPTFDTGGVRIQPGNCPIICHGVDLALNGNDDFILQINEPFWQAGISASPMPPWVNVYGAAVSLDATSGIGPDWTMTAGDCCTVNFAIAFAGH